MRHEETYSKKKGFIQGQTNESLNYRGVLQIKRKINRSRKYNFSIILSGDLNRAKETSKIISRKLGLTVRYFKLLREKDNGSFTGKSSKLINWEKIKEPYEGRRVQKGESCMEF